ncbi:ABC transporter permease [Paenibacillus sp. HN-1]|uniref:ABC transporter permease n=1 Tax=Paenibacillus TaxID=44249 RepID=UPI001CA9305F|nr:MULTISPECIES: ABC transporter permease [Paenibacillus]MBY9077005.1 ABC transporter permease [Paenibacillus sp. CGMCC 1.18879]MBY9086622.1 ABC transporter permease [Paenibacillus sinensis]
MSEGAKALFRAGTKAAEGSFKPEAKAKAAERVGAASRWRAYLSDLGAGALVPAIVVVLWQAGARAGWLSPEFLPSPLTIVQSFIELTVSGGLAQHLGVSLGRAFLGFLIGGAAGLLLGVLNGLFRSAEYLLDPGIQVLRLVPHLAIAPLIILWFGFGEVSKVAIILSGSFFPLYINTFLGIRNSDPKLQEVGRVLGFTAFQRLRRLILPSALPSILLGVRLSLGVAWIGLVVAELIGSQSGVGFLINEAKQNSNTPVIFVGILIFAVIGKLIDSLVRLLERKFLSWRDSYSG